MYNNNVTNINNAIIINIIASIFITHYGTLSWRTICLVLFLTIRIVHNKNKNSDSTEIYVFVINCGSPPHLSSPHLSPPSTVLPSNHLTISSVPFLIFFIHLRLCICAYPDIRLCFILFLCKMVHLKVLEYYIN